MQVTYKDADQIDKTRIYFVEMKKKKERQRQNLIL